ALLMTLVASAPAFAQIDQQQTVNRAAATIERMKANISKDFPSQLANARGVLIVPDLYKGGFILDGQTGNAVRRARQPNGSFGYPAFYSVSGGSIGLQIGLQDISVVFLIMTDKGLNALLNDQFKVGAEAGITFAVIGLGVGAGTTSAMTADI